MGLEDIHLTPKEMDILVRLDRQMPEILADTGMSEGAYRTHYFRMSRKMKTNTRTAMVLKALRLGIVQPEAYESYHEI